MIVDFHNHTHHSYDCSMKPLKILKVAKEKGLDAIVINDHDTIKGGLECSEVNPYDDLLVITGAEIKTNIGDVTGIFLKEEITAIDYLDVITQIKNQGGITILNHPYYHHKLDGMNFNGIDLIEGYNGRLNKELNEKAVRLAKQLNKPVIAGSDAHTYGEIGNCTTEINNEDFLNPGRTTYIQCSKWAPVQSQFIKAVKTKNPSLFFRMMVKAGTKVFTE